MTVMEQLISQTREGETPDWSTLQDQHPSLIGELRQLWATAMIAEDFADLSRLDLAQSGSAGSAPFQQIIASPDGIGSRIGDYELLEEIGRGGMGLVYRARQVSLDRIVALKMLLRGSLASDLDLARFQAEAEAAGRLNHPNIIEVYEVGEYQEQPYFSMKYVEGETLSQRLVSGPLPARDAAKILLPVARAVSAAHAEGVLHRDLKSSNILIDEAGVPFVADFGLAKRVRTDVREAGDDSITQSGAIIGTPAYMSPEQAAGQRNNIGPASDVYSLGACLYAMLTGRPPFQAATQVDVVLMVLEQDPLPPRVVNPQADHDLEMIALKCLQKPIDLRYDTASELADDLQAYLANEPISARSSHLSQIISRAFRETHHAQVLEHWGLLWILHSFVLLVLCLVTNWFQLQHIESRLPYLGLWVVGLGMWAGVFWNLRRRSGPITFVERQIAHVWAGSMMASTLLFAVEALLGLHVLELAPVLGLVSGMVFLVKAGILSGRFYIQALVLFATSVAMAVIPHLGLPNFSLTLFGTVSAACFLLPGLKYYRQHRNSERVR
ncbi:serine/threonine protein kinase [bacterium]|nr:serine/threonine protein kinase [bacterium]